jgi:hypothetical protein
VTAHLTPEALYRLTERLGIDYPDREPTPYQWAESAREAARLYNSPGERTTEVTGPKSKIDYDK